jgi:hypothetical protein
VGATHAALTTRPGCPRHSSSHPPAPQKRNDAVITPASVHGHVVTANKDFPEDAVRDAVVAAIAIKYTQVSA